ncbi:54S ribosomal protein img2, mitochondrial [Cladophialophora chaetospira]|uniref:Large ribosomal subunit protein mL49 n=1 Tax=Cladophialophora chaetospira TaxID=386627 RepID=A0AA38WZ98_9EURO|nr:54S ribosomal protein img2, mitochondrial [Cladophialophora chaetospira]
MPREKYAKITALDKLHRKQKAAIRKERQASEDRAQKMYPDAAPLEPPPVQSAAELQSISLKDRIRSQEMRPITSSLPYSILRTPSKNLPIYQSVKSGGSKHITTIRKIQGDLTALASSVRQALGIDEFMTDMRGRRKANIVINRTTRHVVLRGWRGPEVKRWAEMSGF